LPVDSISIKPEGKDEMSFEDLPFFIEGPIKRILAVASASYKIHSKAKVFNLKSY